MTDGSNTRRDVFAGTLGLTLLAGAANAAPATMSELEKANLKLVDDFCAAWPAHDLTKIMAFFSDTPAYRQSEGQAPAVGHDAVTAKIGAFVGNVTQFEVHDRWARGPMVINERTDHFTGMKLKRWHGVGVFLVKEGKIVEWYDYTMDREVG